MRHTPKILIIAMSVALAVLATSFHGHAASGEDYEAMSLDMMHLNTDKKYQELIDVYEPYATPDNLNFRFYRELGEAFFRKEILHRKVKAKSDWSKADRYLSIAHKLEPDALYVIIHLAILHTYTKDYRKAHYFASMYLDKGGTKRKKDAETILEKYKFYVIEKKIPGPAPGPAAPLAPAVPRIE